jgi:hypothetical protein
VYFYCITKSQDRKKGEVWVSIEPVMLLRGRLITHMAPRRRGGKSIFVSGDRGDNAITKKREREKT